MGRQHAPPRPGPVIWSYTALLDSTGVQSEGGPWLGPASGTLLDSAGWSLQPLAHFQHRCHYAPVMPTGCHDKGLWPRFRRSEP